MKVPIQNNLPDLFLNNKKLNKPTQSGARLAMSVETVADIFKSDMFHTAISAAKTIPPVIAINNSLRLIFSFPFAMQYGARNSQAIKIRQKPDGMAGMPASFTKIGENEMQR